MDLTGSIIYVVFEVVCNLVVTALKHLIDMFRAIYSQKHRSKLRKEWDESLTNKVLLIITTLGSLLIIGFIVKLII